VIVLIPALEPTERLAELVRGLRTAAPEAAVLVVDDGSGPAWSPAFVAAELAGAELIRLPEQRGKGAALRAGLEHVLAHHPGECVVTADSDGQHTVGDILRVAAAVAEPDVLVLGCRAFVGPVPWRSRLGNAVSRGVFRFAAGFAVSDTQTGLRGAPAALLPWLAAIPGERFEYEQRVLLRSRRDGVRIREVGIDTLYLDENAGSHFRPVRDSARVLAPVLAFAASSFLGFLVDAAALFVLQGLTGLLIPSIVGARVLSAAVNFLVNRRLVFRRHGPGFARHAIRYAALALLLLASNIVWMSALTSFGVPLVVAKLVTEAVLFLTSFQGQQRFVFGGPAGDAFGPPAPTEHRERIVASGGMVASDDR